MAIDASLIAIQNQVAALSEAIERYAAGFRDPPHDPPLDLEQTVANLTRRVRTLEIDLGRTRAIMAAT